MIPVFLASSRLGLLQPPQGKTEVNRGVEDAPQEIVTADLTKELDLKVEQFIYSLPENVQLDEYYSVFGQDAQKCAELIKRNLTTSQKNPTSILIGGDHSVVLAHLAAILQSVAEPQTTGVLMLDSHGDLNLRSTSPTGNVHGMWLRPVVDHFDEQSLDRLVPIKVKRSNLKYIGNLDLDPAEQEFVQKNTIQVFPVAELRENRVTVEEQLTTWFSTLSHLHLSIDIDVFDRTVAPATGMPCLEGLFPEDVQPLFEKIRKLPSWSMDIVEVNLRKPGAAQTLTFTQTLLRKLLGKLS